MNLGKDDINSKFNMVLTFLKEKYIQNNGKLSRNVLNDLKLKINKSKSKNNESYLIILDTDIKNLKDISNSQIIVEEVISNEFKIKIDNKNNTFRNIISKKANSSIYNYCKTLVNNLNTIISEVKNSFGNSKILVYEKDNKKLLFIFYNNEKNEKRVLLTFNLINKIVKKDMKIKTIELDSPDAPDTQDAPVESKCPVMSGCPYKNNGTNIWWPNQLDLRVLYQNNPMTSPYDKNFNYTNEFNSLNLNDVKRDLASMMTNSQNWWPADFGNYGPFIVRMAWHSAGTYRAGDGRGGGGMGLLRFAPLNSWPDNANLDKARRLIWAVKQKYGKKISWADIMILAGNVALEIMGFKIIGYGGGRVDVWETDYYTYWGSETKMLDNSKRYSPDGQLEKPLAATNMGLIYVNPQGPNNDPDPILAAYDIRETFGRMGMNDEETVALIGGGHSVGKCHGAASESYVGPPPETAPIQQMNFGWKNSYGTGKGCDTITSGLEVTWTDTPTQFSTTYFKYLFEFEDQWTLIKSPADKYQWVAKDAEADIPDACNPIIKHKPMMLTTDLSLLFDPSYRKISRFYLDNPQEFVDAFANAWFKLTHRDMGPKIRYLGPEVPKRNFIWQDPIPPVDYKLVTPDNVAYLKQQIIKSKLSVYELVYTAWSSASTFRTTDKRGGANGARIRLLPMKFWKVNQPPQLSKVLSLLESIQLDFNNSQTDGTKISLADLIVLAGGVGVELAAKEAGKDIIIPFTPGCNDALQEETDIASFSLLEPKADGFRNYVLENLEKESEKLLIDKAQTLLLTGPELTVLLGGLRAMAINFDRSSNGVLTNRPGLLTNDFFINILQTTTVWKPTCKNPNLFEGYDSNTDKLLWKATRVDLIFGSNSQLRAYCEVYASLDAQDAFISDFIKVWVKIMNNDRFDLKK